MSDPRRVSAAADTGLPGIRHDREPISDAGRPSRRFRPEGGLAQHHSRRASHRLQGGRGLVRIVGYIVLAASIVVLGSACQAPGVPRALPRARLRVHAGGRDRDPRSGAAGTVRSAARAESRAGGLYRGGQRSAREGAAVRARARRRRRRRHPPVGRRTRDPQRHRPAAGRAPRPHHRAARHPLPPPQRRARDRAGHADSAKLPDRLRQRGPRRPLAQLHRDPGVGRRRGGSEPRQQLLHRHRQPLQQPVLGDDRRGGAGDRSRTRPRRRHRRRGGAGHRRRAGRTVTAAHRHRMPGAR